MAFTVPRPVLPRLSVRSRVTVEEQRRMERERRFDRAVRRFLSCH